MSESEETHPKAFSRRIGWLDIPICLLGFAQSVLVDASSLIADVIMLTAGHANYLRDERDFKEIVRNYDNPHGVGSGCPESQD